MPTLVVDLVGEDPVNDEYVLILVETGPWPDPLETRLRELQDRLYNSFDAVVDGHLVTKYPKSKSRNIRLQVDAHDSPPPRVLDFVRKFAKHLETDSECRQAITNSPFVHALRVVNGADIGRHFE